MKTTRRPADETANMASSAADLNNDALSHDFDSDQQLLECAAMAGLTPLYRCEVAAHAALGCYCEDVSKPGFLTCGCPVSKATVVGME